MNDPTTSPLPTAADIDQAVANVRTVVNRSPLQYNERLSEFTDVHPEFENAVERLATWLARLDDPED